MRKVVISGMGVVSPVGSDLDSFWKSLTSGQGGVGRIDRFDPETFPSQIAAQISGFDADAFVPPKEQRRMDRYTHYALGAGKMAYSDSGLHADASLDPDRCGVIVSAGVGGLETMETQYRVLMEKGPKRVSPFCIPQLIANMASGLLAIELGWKGANFAVVTACASALHSLGMAMRLIQRGELDVVMAGGAESTITPLAVAAFSSMRALSTRNDDPAHASRPFDRDRDGFVMGEGAGILVLEDEAHARRRGAHIYAELAGFGMTCDAFHMTAPADDGEGAAKAMTLAMRDADLGPADIDYINAHGTSTPLNDKIETHAIKTALGETDARRVCISSTKSMTGHLLGAAGGIESIACALAMERGIIPPTINYTTPDPSCDLDYTPNTSREFKARACLNNSLGFGGHNACLAMRRV